MDHPTSLPTMRCSCCQSPGWERGHGLGRAELGGGRAGRWRGLGGALSLMRPACTASWNREPLECLPARRSWRNRFTSTAQVSLGVLSSTLGSDKRVGSSSSSGSSSPRCSSSSSALSPSLACTCTKAINPASLPSAPINSLLPPCSERPAQVAPCAVSAEAVEPAFTVGVLKRTGSSADAVGRTGRRRRRRNQVIRKEKKRSLLLLLLFFF